MIKTDTMKLLRNGSRGSLNNVPRYTVQLPIKGTIYIDVDADSEVEGINKALATNLQLQLKEFSDRGIILLWDVVVPEATCIGKLYGKNTSRFPFKR